MDMDKFTRRACRLVYLLVIAAGYGAGWKYAWQLFSTWHFDQWQFFDWMVFIPVVVLAHVLFAVLVAGIPGWIKKRLAKNSGEQPSR